MGRVPNRNISCNGVLRGNSGDGTYATLNSMFVETEKNSPDTSLDEQDREYEEMCNRTDPDEEFSSLEDKHRVRITALE